MNIHHKNTKFCQLTRTFTIKHQYLPTNTTILHLTTSKHQYYQLIWPISWYSPIIHQYFNQHSPWKYQPAPTSTNIYQQYFPSTNFYYQTPSISLKPHSPSNTNVHASNTEILQQIQILTTKHQHSPPKTIILHHTTLQC